MKRIDGGSDSKSVSSAGTLVATPITGLSVHLTGQPMGWMRWCPFAGLTTMVCMMEMKDGLPPCVQLDLSTCGWSGCTIRADVETKDHPIKEKEDEQ